MAKRKGRVVTNYVTAIPLSAWKMDCEGEKASKQKRKVSYKTVTNYFCSPCNPYKQGACDSTVYEWE